MTGHPVIGLAHGSRHPEVADSIAAVVTSVAAGTGVPARGAFLDLTAPDLAATATALVAEGYTEAVVVPLLFTAAYHATVDVPHAAEEASAASGLRLRLAPILGTGDDLAGVLLAQADAAGIAADAPVLLFAVGSSDAAANAAVHDLAARLASRRSAPVRAGFGTTDPRGGALLDELGDGAAVLPLFVSPGLLLEPLRRRTAERGQIMAPPLGDRVAPLVAQRYAATLQAVGATG